MPSGQSDRAGWLRLLAELEAELSVAARTDPLAVEDDGRTPASGWSAPEQLGPLPADLADRARLLLDAEREVIRELADLQRRTGRHLAAVRSVPAAARTEQSVYLDVTG